MNTDTKIKICGIKTLADADCLNTYKPDYTGFVFWAHSHRYLDLDEAWRLRERLDDSIKSAGVYVDEDINIVAEAARRRIIDVIQLHGHEDNEYIRKIKDITGLPVIKAIKIEGSDSLKNVDHLDADYILFDSGMGSGKTFDWQSIKVNISKPYFIAGGINAENVENAIDIFKPFGVDLSSSVETDKKKDPDKIRQVIQAVRQKGQVHE